MTLDSHLKSLLFDKTLEKILIFSEKYLLTVDRSNLLISSFYKECFVVLFFENSRQLFPSGEVANSHYCMPRSLETSMKMFYKL